MAAWFVRIQEATKYLVSKDTSTNNSSNGQRDGQLREILHDYEVPNIPQRISALEPPAALPARGSVGIHQSPIRPVRYSSRGLTGDFSNFGEDELWVVRP